MGFRTDRGSAIDAMQESEEREKNEKKNKKVNENMKKKKWLH